MDKEHAQEVLNGLLLGDGGLSVDPKGRNARFTMQIAKKHADWFRQIKEALEVLGMTVPKTCLKPRGGYYLLQTLTSPLLTQEYSRWYRRTGRIVPDGLKLTPIALSHWHMSDGSTVPYKGIKKNLVRLQVRSRFDYGDSRKLERLLRKLGIKLRLSSTKDVRHKGREYWRFTSGGSETVNRFIDIVKPYIALSFEGKIRRPWLRQRVVDGKLQKGPWLWTSGAWVKESRPA